MQVRVLVVDDSDQVRVLYRRIFDDDAEIEIVAEASSGIEAIALMEQAKPNVVVMDVQMPEMDGVETTQLLKQRWPQVEVLGCSSSDDMATATAMTLAGATAHVDKAKAGTLLVPLVKALASLSQDPVPRESRY